MQTLLTHHGEFHADDVFAVAVLRTLFPTAQVVRTRDPERLTDALLDPQTALVDVGGVDDPSRGAFDHHQLGFARTREDGGPLAAFGLVWRVYGEAYLAHLGVPEADRAEVRESVDSAFVQGIDAADAGALDLDATVRTTGAPVEVRTASLMVDDFNPQPYDPRDHGAHDRLFEKAVKWSQQVLVNVVRRQALELSAAAEVAAADDGSPILVLERMVPWRGHTRPHHLYVVFPAPPDEWQVQAVPPDADPMAQKRPLPEAWRGLRHADLQTMTGVGDAVFCHVGRFVCGAWSREGAIRLAELALSS